MPNDDNFINFQEIRVKSDLHINEIGKHVVTMATLFNDVIVHSFILLMSLIISLDETYTNGYM